MYANLRYLRDSKLAKKLDETFFMEIAMQRTRKRFIWFHLAGVKWEKCT